MCIFFFAGARQTPALSSNDLRTGAGAEVQNQHPRQQYSAAGGRDAARCRWHTAIRHRTRPSGHASAIHDQRIGMHASISQRHSWLPGGLSHSQQNQELQERHRPQRGHTGRCAEGRHRPIPGAGNVSRQFARQQSRGTTPTVALQCSVVHSAGTERVHRVHWPHAPAVVATDGRANPHRTNDSQGRPYWPARCIGTLSSAASGSYGRAAGATRSQLSHRRSHSSHFLWLRRTIEVGHIRTAHVVAVPRIHIVSAVVGVSGAIVVFVGAQLRAGQHHYGHTARVLGQSDTVHSAVGVVVQSALRNGQFAFYQFTRSPERDTLHHSHQTIATVESSAIQPVTFVQYIATAFEVCSRHGAQYWGTGHTTVRGVAEIPPEVTIQNGTNRIAIVHSHAILLNMNWAFIMA